MESTVDMARGKWRGILIELGVAEEFLQNRHMPCPICGGKDRYRFDDKGGDGNYFCSGCGAGNGFTMLEKLKGWDFKEAAREVDKIVGNVRAVKPKPTRDPRPALRAMYRKLSPAGPEVRAYLASRGLTPTRAIKQARHFYYDQGNKVGEFDCMVNPVFDVSGKPITYHITYLDGGEKAKVGSPKKIMTPVKTMAGAAIRLTEIYPHIGLAEGVESALAVMRLFDLPCWATVSSSMMEAFDVPEGIEQVTIFSDNDLNFAGQKSAYTLAHKLSLKGIQASVRLAADAGTDFADQISPVSAVA